MSSIYVQDLLDEVELVISDDYPNEPDAVETGIAIAEEFIYGSGSVEGLALSGVVTSSDYARFGESICNDSDTADFYYGSDADENLFFEVRDLLDEILQDEFRNDSKSIYTRWGECPTFVSGSNAAVAPYFYGASTDDLFQGQPSEIESKKTKVPSSVAAAPVKTPPPQRNTPASSGSTRVNPSTTVSAVAAETISARAYCDLLAKDIKPGGANLIVVGAGFSCEFNYNPNKKDHIVEIGYHGEVVTPEVYRYYPRPVEASKQSYSATASNLQTDSHSTAPGQETSTDNFVIAAGAPAPKPKSLDDLFKLYQGGASQDEIERIMQYKGDVPWDVEDPDGMNNQ